MEMRDENGHRTWFGCAVIILVYAIIFGLSMHTPLVGWWIGIGSLICSVSDMMINGTKDAEMAPYTMTACAISFIGAMIGG